MGVQCCSEYKKQKKMDMERPLKFDGEFFGIQTDSDFNDCFKEDFLEESFAQCQDSSNLNTGCDSSAHIVDRIRLNADIALTPMAELVALARQDLDWNLAGEAQLRRTLWKTKLIQKRERAKNRKSGRREAKIEQTKAIEVISVDRSEDIKKQKNRLSAQISRDRKKEHFQKLQLQNEELKKTINELNRLNSELQKKITRQPEEPKKKGQNLLKTLLILLGIIFLVNLIKGTSGIKSEKPTDRFPISKVELTRPQRNFVSSELRALGLEIPFEMMEKSRSDAFIERGLGSRLLEIKSSLL